MFVSDAFKYTLRKFGSLDIVVNNAGIFNDQVWQKEVDINVVSTRNKS